MFIWFKMTLNFWSHFNIRLNQNNTWILGKERNWVVSQGGNRVFQNYLCFEPILETSEARSQDINRQFYIYLYHDLPVDHEIPFLQIFGREQENWSGVNILTITLKNSTTLEFNFLGDIFQGCLNFYKNLINTGRTQYHWKFFTNIIWRFLHFRRDGVINKRYRSQFKMRARS